MKKEILKEMGHRLALIRKQHKMTQAELASKLDVSPKHISHIERGEVGISPQSLYQLCNLLECDINYIISGKESDPILSLLSKGAVDILYTGTDEDISLLNEYLDLFLKTRKKLK